MSGAPDSAPSASARRAGWPPVLAGWLIAGALLRVLVAFPVYRFYADADASLTALERLVETVCDMMMPTMSGMLARWQGLKRMLKTPHAIAAASASSGVPSTAWLRLVKSCSTFC